MNLNLENKIFLISGGTKGLGYGTAKALLEEGAIVSIGSRSEENLNSALSSLSEFGNKVRGYTLDASNFQSITEWVTSSLRDLGRIDGLLVNAGGPPAGNFLDFKDSDWENAFNLTLMSAVRMIKVVLPEMIKNKSGTILTITSLSIKEPVDNLILSNVFRSGVASLVKSLANELGDKGIRINNIVPGRIDTDRVRFLDSVSASKTSKSVENIISSHHQDIPIGRYGTIEEFGAVAAFLLSDKASYITGSNVVVDGGKIKSH
jgi:3-oxoacyl-[acyl-carrier protein] reductase